MKLAVLGCGKMGSALVGGIVESGGLPADQILVFDAYAPAAHELAEKTGVQAVSGAEGAVDEAGAVLVCVKPHDVAKLGDVLRTTTGSRLVISIAAGVRIETLREAFGESHRIVRVMPNTPALLGCGVAAIAADDAVTEDDLALVETIFGSVGEAFRVPEKQLDAITGLSGSGPAYAYTFIEALADGGVLMGLPRDKATLAAAQTVLGAARMVLETGLHPAQLRDQVTSPGGTTMAGIEVLEEEGFRAAVLGAVRAGTERSEELG